MTGGLSPQQAEGLELGPWPRLGGEGVSPVLGAFTHYL